jgi:exodeoxyribonuclease VII large subunit
MGARLEAAHKSFALMAASLEALSPLAVLQRGYAIAQDKDGLLLRDAHSVSIGDHLSVRLARGRLKAKVDGVEET